MTNFAALETYLKPFYNLFEDNINEIMINEPQEVWIEKAGEMKLIPLPQIDLEHLKGLARLVAQSTDQTISEEKPLLSATLPNGFRIQIVFPPACDNRVVVMSIRKSNIASLSMDDYAKFGAFDQTSITEIEDESSSKLLELLEKKQIKEFITFAVKSKKNIIISGGTSTGKTTFTNAALSEIDPQERILTIEDAREVNLPNHKNKVHLISSKGNQGRAKVDTQSLIEASLRLRPDRIIVGELRGAEAFSFLRAINTGHPGSIATLHADTPIMAMSQLKLMVMQSGINLPADEIEKYIDSVIDIIVQLKRAKNGKRYVSEIYYKEARKPKIN